MRAGTPASAPAHFPAGTSIPLDGKRPTLILLAHPRCPCTRATIGELAIGMRQMGDRVAAHVLFAEAGAGKSPVHTDLWNSAARIPGVRVDSDPGGEMAARFGARTSGQVLLYAPNGRLMFSGGITATRAHMGDNAGLATIVSLVRGQAAALSGTKVFGCPLFDEEP